MLKENIAFIASFLIIFSLSTISCGQTKINKVVNSTKSDKIDSLVSLFNQYDGFNGAILVAHEGEVIYKKGFGLANMEWDIPNEVDTKFRIGSVTKQFTAMLILQLVAEGQLDLHQPISNYLPDYPKTNADRISIHQLLTHTSGTPNNYKSDDRLPRFPDKQRPVDLVQAFSSIPLEFTPGEKYAYSNSGYIVLGYIIETVTGNTYEEVLKEKVLAPLGMENTGMDRYRTLTKNRASGYFKGFGDYFNANYIDMSSVFSAGAMYSTVEDLFLWDQALYTETLLPQAYLDMAFSKQVADPDYGGHYGYGWALNKKPVGNTATTIEAIWHDGVIDGFCASFTRIPSSKSAIILLNNTRRAYLNSITTAVTGILKDTTYDFPKKPLAKFMSETIKKDGINQGILFYKKYKDAGDYYIDETELIVEGYRLLHAGNAIDAAEVFKLAIEVFPDKDNPYDSYAESQVKLGNTAEAIENYKKSLALNPNNYNAIEMLKKLQ